MKFATINLVFNRMLLSCNASVGYVPLKDDVNYTSIQLFENILPEMIFVSNNKESEPYIWADKCEKYALGKKTCVLIPGREFDIYGTRHGRGGGWYDRFLSKVPKKWIRIGVVDQSQMCFYKLKKEVWDETVDWIVVKKNDCWDIYETKAREHCW